MYNLLVIDDEKDFCNATEAILIKEGYRVERAYSGPEALQLLGLQQVDLVLLDMIMPVMHGLETLDRIKRLYSKLPVIVLTGDSQPQTAVEAMKLGAYDYLTKPVDWERMKTILRNGLLTSNLKEEVKKLRGELIEKLGFGNVIGVSRHMQDVFRQVEKVLDKDTTITLHGECGTGKKLLARAIHFNSTRREKPFVAVNCAAMPENLLESELFGYGKGAFPEALATRVGKFELADGGTLFLDEIAEMPTTTQLKILSVLQEHKFERIGSDKSIEVNVRVITATDKNLKDEMKAGRFREELYYRINVFPIMLPPLRERKEDIPTLAAFFIRNSYEKIQHGVLGVSGKAMDYLLRYHWPGNVRELENAIEGAMLNASTGIIQPEHLPLAVTSNRHKTERDTVPYDFQTQYRFSRKIVPLEEIEKEALVHALKTTNYNMSTTASALGIGRTTLYRKVHKYCIPVPRLNGAGHGL